MERYRFTHQGKTYELAEDQCAYLLNDEEKPVKGIDISYILELLNQHEEVDFEAAYYDQPCEKCQAGKAEKARYFPFLEYHFFIYTKNAAYVVSSISKEYEHTSFNQLAKEGKVDHSYIVSVVVCSHCGDYSIEINQCEV